MREMNYLRMGSEEFEIADKVARKKLLTMNSPVNMSFAREKYYDMETIQGDDYVSPTDKAGLQSCGYNSDKDTILLGFIGGTGTTSNGLLVEVDKDFNVLQRRTNMFLEHCNDITYNPNTKKYYIAPARSPKVVYEINSDDLSLNRTIQTPELEYGGLAQINYDEETDTYIGQEWGTGKTYLFDNEFNIVKLLFVQTKGDYTDEINETYDNVRSTDYQGSCLWRNFYVSLFWIYAPDSKEYSYARLLFYSLDENEMGELKSSIDVPVALYDEPEGLAFYDGRFTCVGYTNKYLTYRNIYVNKLVQSNEERWVDIKSSFQLTEQFSSASLDAVNFRYNPKTHEVDISGVITRINIATGVNQIFEVTQKEHKPLDYYAVGVCSSSSKLYACLMSARRYFVINADVGQGSANVFFSLRYIADGVVE